MLILASVLAIFVYGLIAPILGALLPTYHLLPSQEGAIASVQALGLVIASLAAGPVIDLKGNKLGLLIGLGLVVAALVSAPNAGGYSSLLVIYFVLGLGGGVVVTGANALVGAVEPGRRGSALNFLNLFFGLGGIVTTYVAVKGLSGHRLLRHRRVDGHHVSDQCRCEDAARGWRASFQLNQVPTLLATPGLILLSFFLFLYVACEVGVWNWLNRYLQTAGFDPTRAGHVVSYGFAFGILVGRVVVSRILIKVPALTVTLFASVLMAITTFAMLRAALSER